MQKVMPAMIFTLVLVACSNGGSSNGSSDSTGSGNNDLVGTFIDSPVAGIEYTAGNRTGVTDSLGRFYYRQGEQIQFSIADITLPSLAAGQVIHVSEIFGTDETDAQVINLARLLISLDEDSDPDNGISLGANALSMAEGQSVNFASESFEEDISTYLTSVTGSAALVSEGVAVEHIRESLLEAENLVHDCGIECVPRPTFNEQIEHYNPRHQQVDVNLTSTISITLTEAFTNDIQDTHIEIFGLNPSMEDCRIDWPGLRCGNLGIASYDIEGLEIVFGQSYVEDRTVHFTLDSALTPGNMYVVHIFNDGEDGDGDDFKTWWLFYTSEQTPQLF